MWPGAVDQIWHAVVWGNLSVVSVLAVVTLDQRAVAQKLSDVGLWRGPPKKKKEKKKKNRLQFVNHWTLFSYKQVHLWHALYYSTDQLFELERAKHRCACV